MEINQRRGTYASNTSSTQRRKPPGASFPCQKKKQMFLNRKASPADHQRHSTPLLTFQEIIAYYRTPSIKYSNVFCFTNWEGYIGKWGKKTHTWKQEALCQNVCSPQLLLSCVYFTSELLGHVEAEKLPAMIGQRINCILPSATAFGGSVRPGDLPVAEGHRGLFQSLTSRTNHHWWKETKLEVSRGQLLLNVRHARQSV